MKSLGFSEIRYQSERAKGFFDRKLSAKEFLGEFDMGTIEIIVKAISLMFEAQKNAMNRCYSTLQSFSKTQLISQVNMRGDFQNYSSTQNAQV